METNFDFKKVITGAREVVEDPAASSTGSAVEMPPLFEEPPSKKVRIMSSEVSEDKVAVEIAMTHHTKVFTVWRPWEECSRCKKDMAGDDPVVTLPEEGDYNCPHTNALEYKNVVDMCLRGEGVVAGKEMFYLQDGTRCVHLEWMESDQEALRKLKRKMEAKKKNQVYPPDVKSAFQD